MQDRKLKECKRFVVFGLCLLLLGSLLLLAGKVAEGEAMRLATAVAGGVTLLLGNGCILYGLLIFCDAR